MRSVSHQMHAAKFPVHRDLAGFDFEVSPVDRKLVNLLAGTAFMWGYAREWSPPPAAGR